MRNSPCETCEGMVEQVEIYKLKNDALLEACKEALIELRSEFNSLPIIDKLEAVINQATETK